MHWSFDRTRCGDGTSFLPHTSERRRWQLTSIKLIVTGAKAEAELDGVLTSGAVGIPVTIQYDSTWDNLTKDLVCTSGKWGPGDTTRTILNVKNASAVAHEVMIADNRLYLGIEGRNADGTLVIRTVWADCGTIYPGANANAEPSATPTLPIWAQLQQQILDLKENGIADGVVTSVNGVEPDENGNVQISPAGDGSQSGEDGEDGATFTPSVTAAGVLSWTNDQGLENPDPVSIMGPQGLQGEIGPQGPQGKQGIPGIAQTPLFANSIEKCTDTDKVYVLPDGYIYAYLLGESSGAAYTNILDGTELHLNQRINSSESYVALNGYVSTDYLPMKPGDVVRVNRDITNASYDKNRGICYNESKGIAYGNDSIFTYYAPVTNEGNGVYSFVFGQVYNTYGDASSGTKMIATIADEGYLRMNIGLSASAVTEEDVAGLVITLNEPIEASVSEEYAWRNTGHAFIPADYEDRILTLEDKVGKITAVEASAGEVFAPSPQLAAEGSDGTDFDAANMTAQEIFDYADAAAASYPNYITRETLGKDASGTLDIHRYTLCRHYYKAWQKQNYPVMYGWVNGSTVIYSESVSPRIGDTMYATAYIGTAYSTVTAVDNANQSRTVNGQVFTRDKSYDVDPTLVYTSILTGDSGDSIYDVNKAKVTAISSITDTTLTGADNVIYTRYPMGDRDSNMQKFPVVMLGANEHGYTPDPREPAIVCARLIKDLAECKNADNGFLNYLKNNVMLVIIPVINPYGFNRSDGTGYYNSNGVNINRNYDCPGWGNLDDAGPQGDYGGSEIETQYVMNTITESKSAVAISIHALGHSTGGGNVLCHYQGNGFSQAKLNNIAEIMFANYSIKFTDYGTTPPDSNQGGKSPAYITWAGAKGGLIEMQAEGASTERNTAYVLEADYTLLLQCINMWLTDYWDSV